MKLYIDCLAFLDFHLFVLNFDDDNAALHDRAMRDINKALSAYAAENPYA